MKRVSVSWKATAPCVEFRLLLAVADAAALVFVFSALLLAGTVVVAARIFLYAAILVWLRAAISNMQIGRPRLSRRPVQCGYCVCC